MSETNAERLERIKKDFSRTLMLIGQKNGKTLFGDDIQWLIEQAGYTESLGKKTVELNEFLQGISNPKHLGRNVVDVAMDIIKEQAERMQELEAEVESADESLVRAFSNYQKQLERAESVETENKVLKHYTDARINKLVEENKRLSTQPTIDEIKVVKYKKGEPTVINWNGERWVKDSQTTFRGGNQRGKAKKGTRGNTKSD